MAGRPKKIVVASDGLKRFGPEVFDLIRTKLAGEVGGNVNFAVKLAADNFALRKPSEVTVEEMGDAIPQIVAKCKADTKAESGKSASGGRLPLNDEAQQAWDSGKWRGQLTVHGLRERFAKEITDSVDITKSMVEAYVGELAVEKEKIAKLVDERPDPDSGPVKCESPVHRGDERSFQPSIAHKLFRNSTGALERQKHDQGDEFILVGHFLVLKDEEGKVSGQAAYCAACRDAAREMARNAEPPIKLTFYTAAGAKRVQEASARSAETNAALMSQLKSAGARTFDGWGQGKTWKTDRVWHRGGHNKK